MKRIATRPAAVLVAALSLGACSASERMVAPDADVSAPSLARSGQATFGNLIAALNNIAVNIDELNALNDLTIGDITLVDVDNLLSGNNVRALNNALNRNEVDIGILQNFLNDIRIQDCAILSCDAVDVTLQNFLNQPNIVITDVIAIDVLSGGDLIIFTR